jgi:predicted Zn-dependent peptidase
MTSFFCGRRPARRPRPARAGIAALMALTVAAFAPRGFAAQPPQAAQYLADFEKRVTVRVLPNGLTLIVCQRPQAPVFSYNTFVDAGDVNDPSGQSGLAHMFEHLAFKGTHDIGTTDYAAEKVALDKVEQANQQLEYEQLKETGRSPERIAELGRQFEAAQAEAQKYVVPNQFTEIAEQNGATGLNASTGLDETQFFWSMPSNRLELWAYLESDRLANTVPREFYKERDVVEEERRMRIDSSPTGRLLEQFVATAYVAHNYGRSGVGWPSELSKITATEAMEFHRKYYVGSDLVVAVAGDVKASDLDLLEKYFSRVPSGPRPEGMVTVEPRQIAEKRVYLREGTQPFYIEGYHRPGYRSPDDAVYDAIADILSNGRVSRLYRSLVRDQQIAAEAQGFSGYPGDKYPGLFSLYAVPLPGHTPEQMREAIHREIEKLKTADVTDDELAQFRTRARADLLRGLADNQGLASDLAEYQTRYGDWREIFRQLDRIDRVSKADIRRVAAATFTASNRTAAEIDFEEPVAPAGPAAEHREGAR